MGKPTGFLEYEREVSRDISPKERIQDFHEFHVYLSKEKQQIQRSALRQILNHVHFPLLDKIRSHSPQCGSETPRSGRAPQG